MNRETGEIKMFKDGEEIPENYLEILKEDMTPKQEKTKQVSKHDNKSKLGKKFKTARAERKWKAKQIRNQNKKN